MPQQKAGGGVLGKVGRTPAPSQACQQDIGVSHCNADSAHVHVSGTGKRARAHSYFLTDLTICAACLAACALLLIGAGWLADHGPHIILAACIALLGVLIGAMLGTRA